MNKSILLAIVGVVVGVAVAFAGFTFLMGGGGETVAAAEPEVVSVPGKLGPHITLSDRVFNLLPESGQPQTYLKLQTVIEFETKDERWHRVLTGCGAHGARLTPASDVMVSSQPSAPGVESGVSMPETAGGAAQNPCDAEQAALLAEFDHEIGTGRALIEDAVTSIVTGHTASEIATPAGKDALKAEIQDAVNELIEEPHVTRVLFLNFITQ